MFTKTVKEVKELLEDIGIDLSKEEVDEMFSFLEIEEYLPKFENVLYMDSSFEGYDDWIEIKEKPDKEFVFDTNRIGKIWNNLVFLSSDSRTEECYMIFS